MNARPVDNDHSPRVIGVEPYKRFIGRRHVDAVHECAIDVVIGVERTPFDAEGVPRAGVDAGHKCIGHRFCICARIGKDLVQVVGDKEPVVACYVWQAGIFVAPQAEISKLSVSQHLHLYTCFKDTSALCHRVYRTQV